VGMMRGEGLTLQAYTATPTVYTQPGAYSRPECPLLQHSAVLQPPACGTNPSPSVTQTQHTLSLSSHALSPSLSHSLTLTCVTSSMCMSSKLASCCCVRRSQNSTLPCPPAAMRLSLTEKLNSSSLLLAR
jgi:hypothetical protein